MDGFSWGKYRDFVELLMRDREQSLLEMDRKRAALAKELNAKREMAVEELNRKREQAIGTGSGLFKGD
jgi:hypothetical protein